MILLPKDYDTTADFLVGLDEYFTQEAIIYIAKAEYDLHRECEKTDFFINTLSYTVSNGFVDIVTHPGFDDYAPPAAVWNIYYYDGSSLTYQNNTTTTYTPGDTFTFEVIGLNGADITYYEVSSTVSAGNNFTLTNTSFVDDVDDDADFSFTIPTTWYGDVVVTVAIASVPSESIIYGLSESPYSYGTITSQDGLGVATSLSDVLIGDLNSDNAVNTADLIIAVGRNYGHRLNAYKHLSITPQNTTYDPTTGTTQYFNVIISPAVANYVFNTSSSDGPYTGQLKSLTDLQITYVVLSGSQPAGGGSFIPQSGSLNADGSLNKSIGFTSNSDTVSVIFGVTRALNTASLPAVVDQNTNNQLTLSFGSLGQSDLTDTFEPGSTQTVEVYLNAQVGVNAGTPYCVSHSGNSSLQSRYTLEAFTTSDYSGTPVISENYAVEPTSTGPSNTIQLMTTHSISIPGNIDVDLYWRSNWSFLRYSNFIQLSQLSDSAIDLTNIGQLSPSFGYYPYTDSSQTFSLAFTPDNGITASDYRITLTATDNLNVSNNYTFATNDLMSNGPWTWSRDDFSQSVPIDQITLYYSISLA